MNLIGLVVFALKDTEKSKVLQSIASVIQALPPMEAMPAVEVSMFVPRCIVWLDIVVQALINPVVAKLFEALQSSAQVDYAALWTYIDANSF